VAAHHLAFQGQDVKGGKPALNQKMPHKYQVEQKFLKKYVTLSLYCNMYIYILQYIVTLYMDERVMSKINTCFNDLDDDHLLEKTK
jgi:hypothetical protein